MRPPFSLPRLVSPISTKLSNILLGCDSQTVVRSINRGYSEARRSLKPSSNMSCNHVKSLSWQSSASSSASMKLQDVDTVLTYQLLIYNSVQFFLLDRFQQVALSDYITFARSEDRSIRHRPTEIIPITSFQKPFHFWQPYSTVLTKPDIAWMVRKNWQGFFYPNVKFFNQSIKFQRCGAEVCV